jgi:lysozyme family protein
MAIFEISHKKTLSFEGEISNHPADGGGLTFRGISRKHWPDWEGWYYVDEGQYDSPMLDKAVEKFYRYNFWKPLNLDNFSQSVANQVYDIAVNMGTLFAGQCLQMALSPFGLISVDGKIGPKTLELYQSITMLQKDSIIAKLIVYYRVQRYFQIVMKDKSQSTFLLGWIRRAYEI